MPDVDLNCRENVSLNSDSDEETIENKVFPQQRFSPVTNPMRPAALRPHPIKVRAAAAEVTLVTATPAVRPSGSVPTFQPHGEVFKARAAQTKNSSGKREV